MSKDQKIHIDNIHVYIGKNMVRVIKRRTKEKF